MLDKMLAGKAVAVTPFIDEIEQGMGGGSTPQDLETMFQLLYLRFTQPRADPTAFAAMASQAQGAAREPDGEPGRRVQPDDRRRAQPEQSAAAAARRRRRWTSGISPSRWRSTRRASPTPSNFTFVFVGSFTPETIKPLVETYIASLPATHAHETWRDLGITPPAGVVEKTIEKGIAPKSQVAIVFSGPFEYDDAHRLALRTMTLLLQSRLFDTIRQELGGTYSITATPDIDEVPAAANTPCGSSGRAIRRARRRSCSACSRRSTFVRDTRFVAGQMALIREALLREFEQNSQDNGYLLSQIARRYEDGDAADVAAVDQPAGADRRADRRRDPAGGADAISNTEQLREGHADARREVSPPSGDEARRTPSRSARSSSPS